MGSKRRAGPAQEHSVHWRPQDGNQHIYAVATRTSRRRWRMTSLADPRIRDASWAPPIERGSARQGNCTAGRSPEVSRRSHPMGAPVQSGNCSHGYSPSDSDSIFQRGGSQGESLRSAPTGRRMWVPSSPPPPQAAAEAAPPAWTPLTGPCPPGGPDQAALLGVAEDGDGGYGVAVL